MGSLTELSLWTKTKLTKIQCALGPEPEILHIMTSIDFCTHNAWLLKRLTSWPSLFTHGLTSCTVYPPKGSISYRDTESRFYFYFYGLSFARIHTKLISKVRNWTKNLPFRHLASIRCMWDRRVWLAVHKLHPFLSKPKTNSATAAASPT